MSTSALKHCAFGFDAALALFWASGAEALVERGQMPQFCCAAMTIS
jgi:hypothetical protein